MSAVSEAPNPQINIYGPYLNFRSADAANNTWNFSAMFITKGTAIPNMLIKEAGNVANMIRSQNFYSENGYQFCRFDLSFQRDLKERKVVLATKAGENYKNVEICIPGTETPLRFAYFSCNGFDDPSKSEAVGGIQPLWRDVNSSHKSNPFHILIGGGDQIYCDQIWLLKTIHAWRQISHEDERFEHPFTEEMAEEVNNFYLSHYLEHYNEPEFREAMGMIPGIFSWDDHDIFDGWGSYRPEENNCQVFQGIFTIAKKWYLIFQQQMLATEASSLDYFGKSSFHTIKVLGDTAVLALDARSERTYSQFVDPESYAAMFERLYELSDEVKHLLVMFSVPLKYADFKYVEKVLKLGNDVNISENIRKLLNKPPSHKAQNRGTDEVDLLDDLGDHPQNKRHIAERLMFIETLQKFAEEKQIRVTTLSGDVHLASQGHFASKDYVKPEHDPKRIEVLTSSGISNPPPTKLLVHLMNPQVGKIEKVNEFTIAKLTEWAAEDKSSNDAFVRHRNWMEIQKNPEGLFVRLHAEDEKNSDDRKLITVTKTYVTTVPNLIVKKPEIVAEKEKSGYGCSII